ncbi:Sugar kinase of the NBD/HSP70 family, may contain an N-terminal HTH domain [Actinacidiphila yanglinensis]|uniref:Sugar kinase of the NBD/HSP70 family, may contain an N-terminal HTH domain n=1 Tax=Actinacidiphila yanglinensis TaxID=310779 RepID=A0A1H6CX05_9ACTN|nr:ROK family transcriptional regulator [Actinacidiphila yanglinensis]SEG77293.1 Sugar kinase of the NBD/HSP70 family, may contain an N-terminal HTH domain [Actinacidiphila yanglinensis]
MKRDVGRTTRDLRRHNRTSVLTRLYLHGPASRFDLMRATGLSSATVSNVVTGLVGDGLVAEAGLLDSDGGRPRTLLEVRPGFGQVAGVDIGETHVQVGLFDWTLDTLATATYPMDEGRPDPALLAGLVTAGIEEVTAKAGTDSAALLGVGVGVPGAVLPDGRVHAPTLGWSGVPFDGLLRPHIAAPLHLDNCARTLGQAEMWRGAGRGAERAIVALLAVGVGAAVATGSPGGVTSTTSEWGHTVVEKGGAPCRCGSRGCLEAYVGADAILAHHEQQPGAAELRGSGTEQRLAALVADARRPGAAADTVRWAAGYLGVGIANLVNLLSPDRVILSGWVSALLGPEVLPAVREVMDRHVLDYMTGGTVLELGRLGQEAVALGAATLPVHELLTAGGR